MPHRAGEQDRFRQCRDCGAWKPLGDFQVNTRRPSGRGSYCKPCFNERSKASYARKIEATKGRKVKTPVPTPEGTKLCPSCNQVKPHEEFVRTKAKASGLHSYCKECHKDRTYEAAERLYGGMREYHLRHRYGIGEADFQRMLFAQGGKCAICWAPDPEHVDHDHVSGEVRGILCFNCNAGLGNFRDTGEFMERAVEYLKGMTWRSEKIEPGVWQLHTTRSGLVLSRSS